MSSKLKIFKSEEFGEVRSLMINNETYFVGMDIANILGYKKARNALSLHISEEYKILSLIISREGKGGVQMTTMINENGVIELLTKSKTKSSNVKYKIKKFFTDSGIISEKLYLIERREIAFLDKLDEVLNVFELEGLRQYRVERYKIDYYIKELNIAIEYDENTHAYYSYKKEEGRQEEIENKLDCSFIRISDENSDEYNIGYVIKKLFKINKVAWYIYYIVSNKQWKVHFNRNKLKDWRKEWEGCF